MGNNPIEQGYNEEVLTKVCFTQIIDSFSKYVSAFQREATANQNSGFVTFFLEKKLIFLRFLGTNDCRHDQPSAENRVAAVHIMFHGYFCTVHLFEYVRVRQVS